MRKISLLLCLLFGFNLKAQIINVESKRMITDTIGWSGSAELSLELNKSVNELFKVNNQIHVQYKTHKHLILFLNTIGFDRVDGTDFINNGTQHLRFNYKIKPHLTYEAFMQNQYNSVSKITYRRLVGTGLRWKMSDLERYKMYLGSLIMFENEKNKGETVVLQHDWRNSSYFSFTFKFTEHTQLVSTTYLQPRLDFLKDYRVSHQSVLNLKISKKLGFNATFTYNFDAYPVNGIPKEEYKLTNGLTYVFQ
ncbi:MAG: DUF481 domain-containing protein [Flavobacteriaceae bacterium]|nr:DUF481 domain-containing protein [Flavobacteriaceae bacterium]